MVHDSTTFEINLNLYLILGQFEAYALCMLFLFNFGWEKHYVDKMSIVEITSGWILTPKNIYRLSEKG